MNLMPDLTSLIPKNMVSLTPFNLTVDNFVAQPPKEVWTREIPKYVTGHIDDSPSSSHSSGSSLSRYRSITNSPPQSPALLKGYILNQKVGNGEKKEDSSVLIVPSHSVLGHLGIRTSLSDGLLATTVTMRYHHKVLNVSALLIIVCDYLVISFN